MVRGRGRFGLAAVEIDLTLRFTLDVLMAPHNLTTTAVRQTVPDAEAAQAVLFTLPIAA